MARKRLRATVAPGLAGEKEREEAEKEKEEEENADSEDDGEFEVEKIVFHKCLYKKHFYYFVKWVGYGEDENTWEHAENLDNCPQKRADYHGVVDSLEIENPAEFKRHMADGEKAWKKSRPKSAPADEGRSDDDREKGDGKSGQPTPKTDQAVGELGKKRKSQDEEKEEKDDGGVAKFDHGTKKPKLTLKNWLEKGSKPKNEAAGGCRTSLEYGSSPTAVAKSASAPGLNNGKSHVHESFDQLFKRRKTSAQAAENTGETRPDSPRPGIAAAPAVDAVAAANKKLNQMADLKRWENEMNSVSKDPGKIVVENVADVDGPPPDFKYINDYLPRNDIVFPDDPLIGCVCAECDVKGCCPDTNEAKMAYTKYKRLRDYVNSHAPIFECNRRCSCGPDCRNRVVQRGRSFKLCIFKTNNGRGWGVKTLQSIKAGTYVTTYLGELIDHEEAERRGKDYDQVGMTYLFDLDYADGETCYTVDAARYGNVSHFINHSCDPNLQIHNVFINNIDIQFPYLCLFACRDIVKDEELTFDYQMSGATEELEESSLNMSTLGNANLSESRYDADRSGEESELYITAPEDSFVGSKSTTPKRGKLNDAVFNTPDVAIGKENVTPDESSRTKMAQADPTTPSVAAPAKDAASQHLAASTPRKKHTPKKALDKKTPCLCGTSKCRGFLMT